MKNLFYLLFVLTTAQAQDDTLTINHFLGNFTLTTAPPASQQLGSCPEKIEVALKKIDNLGKVSSQKIFKLNDNIIESEDIDQDYFFEMTNLTNKKNFYSSVVKAGALSDNSDDGKMLVIMSSGFTGQPGINKKGFLKENKNEWTGWVSIGSNNIFKFVRYFPKTDGGYQLTNSCFYLASN
jgi:hypothetical protein